MPAINVFEVLKGSFTLAILLVCSVVSLTFAIERWWYFRSISVNIDAFLERIRELLEGSKHAEAMKLANSTPGPVAAIARVALSNRSKSKTELGILLSAAQIDERTRLERFLNILGTMGNTAPFIGLFGTVVGIIRAFHDLARSGSGGPSVVAAGIAEALIATAGGLAVAIPSVMLYNYFMKKVKDLSSSMEASAMRIVVFLGMA